MNPFSLDGKVALVTGANTGIGQAIAVAMAQAGAEVIAAGRRDCDETLALIGQVSENRGRALRLDFSDPMAARDVFASERIDILVNNAGIIRRADAVDFTEADWDEVMDVNLKALFFTCQAFARAALPRGRGKIVNIASLLSFQGGIRVPSYTASKHGVAGLTKLMANEWAAQGLNVNAIAPGYIETNNTQALRADPARSAAILDRIPAGRWGRPEDIGQTAVFLSAPASDYINGAILNVDGGWLAR
ncbi:2-dehydro-3-deoxy-D-gluconate 5-dehydrogenase KduD [Paracoccus sp. S3-43]|uniref:2-dehydro-3-deoxy-D-gluconate 5-dehydrogenase KduD n=1 Tax=Paracoccus sp. S3-43 TaxID=3030011 RepID=UPI0023AEDC77|nr:2-dehydro-3-deoxy-D-gluconate 5-dehydrogenase KduD [Paracoccus sp. S3-43]WEF24825.1 2-dehydro-3-deoxy-D-gluconate 5-dehydrogenase KduD [Paracoccus sp. S3-43]